MNSVRWQQKLDKEQLEVICLYLRSSTTKLFLLPAAKKNFRDFQRDAADGEWEGGAQFRLPSTHSEEQILH